MPTEPLGRFGHHPDPAVDFEIEVQAIEGLVADCRAGLTTSQEVDQRITRALAFSVGGNASAIRAKHLLREIALEGSW